MSLFIEAIQARDSDLIQALKADVIHEKNLREPSPQVEAIAREALRTCGITQDIIVLESDDANAIGGYTFTKHGQIFMVLCGGASTQTIFTAYHESGHLYYDHPTEKGIYQNIGNGILAIITAYLMYKIVTTLKGAGLLRTMAISGAALATAYLARALGSAIAVVHRIIPEREADLFACQQLARNGKSAVIFEIINQSESVEQRNPFPNFLIRAILLMMGIPHQTPKELVDCLKKCLQENKIISNGNNSGLNFD